jgi:hypothetical protein
LPFRRIDPLPDGIALSAAICLAVVWLTCLLAVTPAWPQIPAWRIVGSAFDADFA